VLFQVSRFTHTGEHPLKAGGKLFFNLDNTMTRTRIEQENNGKQHNPKRLMEDMKNEQKIYRIVCDGGADSQHGSSGFCPG
jgi:hypothetical protein